MVAPQQNAGWALTKGEELGEPHWQLDGGAGSVTLLTTRQNNNAELNVHKGQMFSSWAGKHIFYLSSRGRIWANIAVNKEKLWNEVSL